MDLNLTDYFRALLVDIGADVYTLTYILRRLRNEGPKFVTVVLPQYAKHILSCIEQGVWVDFSTTLEKRRGLPKLFSGYLRELFVYNIESRCYHLAPDPCPVALWAIRQVCEYAYKIAFPFSDEQIAQATEKFVEVDAQVPGVGDYDTSFVNLMRKSFLRHYPLSSSITFDSMVRSAHPGPGTYTGCDPRTFWKRNYLLPEVQEEDSDWAYGLRRLRRSADPDHTARNEGLRFDRRTPRPQLVNDPLYSEVLFVPKDSRGPRTIVREPYTKLQFQMGFNTQMSKALERDTRNRVNFESQVFNRDLALSSSITREYSTLDLKDASDRVSYAIIDYLFRHTPCERFLLSFRTHWARLPSGVPIRLKKLAGMGSGFTFPCMALVIHLAICTYVSKHSHLPYDRIMNHVYVYGDDIVVPTRWTEWAKAALSCVGLEVNLSKSYSRGPFRESCGGDYLHGNDVTPVRLRLSNAVPTSVGTVITCGDRPAALLSLVKHAHELSRKQCFTLAELIYQQVEGYLGPLPLVTEDSPILGRLADREEVLCTLEADDFGTFRSRSYWVVKPIRGPVIGMCPYRFMQRLFAKVGVEKWHRDLFPGGSQACFGAVTVPRRVKLVQRKLSSFSQT